MSDFNSEDIKHLLESISSLSNDGVRPMGDSAKGATGHLNNMADAVKKLDSLKDLTKSVLKAKDALETFADGMEDSIQKQEKEDDETSKKRKEAVKKFGKDVVSAGGAFAAAVADAHQGTSKYVKSLDQLGLASGQLGAAFGKYGDALGWSSEKLLQWAAAGLKQNDQINDAYVQLSKFGQLDSSDFKELMHDFHDAGFLVQNAARYVEIVTRSSSELAMLAGSASAGRKALNDVFQGTLDRDVKERLLRFGYTTDEMFEGASNFLSSIAMSSRYSKADTAALHKQTIDYLETFSQLSELTGQNRDAMMKDVRMQEEDAAFQIFLEELRAQGKEAQANQAQAIVAALAPYGKEKQTGVMQYMRSEGQLLGKESARAYYAFGGQGMEGFRSAAMRDYKNPQEAAAGIAKSMHNASKATDEVVKQFGGTAKMMASGKISAVGLDPGMMRGRAIYRNDPEKALAEINKNILTKQEGVGADRKALEALRTENELKVGQATDNMVYSMGDLAVAGVSNFTAAVKEATDALTALSDWSGASDNWNRSFKTFDKLTDVAEELTKQQKKQVELQKTMNEADEEIAAADQALKEADEAIKKGGITGAWKSFRRSSYESDRTAAVEKKARAQQDYGRSEREASRAERAGTRIQQAGGDVLAGLPLYSKTGDVHRPGEYVDPKLVALMHRIKKEIPNFSHFTSVNDNYHAGDPTSLHSKGRAVDFVLTERPTPEQADKIVGQLRSMGLMPLDEYYHKSTRATGDHFHAGLGAATGGVFNGPKTGYKVELHGKEAVVPMASSQNFAKSYTAQASKSVTKHSLNNAFSESGGTTSGGMSYTDNMLRNLMNMMIGRFDDMIMELQTANNTQAKIAKTSKKS